MPIRTRRGRAAAYRAVWEWPLRSPARLFVCLAGVVIVVVAISVLGGALGGGPSTGRTGTTGTASPFAPAAPDPDDAADAPPAVAPAPELVPQTLPVDQAPPAASSVALRWTQAWADHPPGTTPQAWSGRLAPYTTEEYLAVLASVDPANVPGTRVTGAPEVVQVRPESVRVQVPTDAVRLELLLVQVAPGDWRVSGYDGAS